MNIEDVQSKRDDLAIKMNKLIIDFKKETGIFPFDIYYEKPEIIFTSVSGAKQTMQTANVSITIKLEI